MSSSGYSADYSGSVSDGSPINSIGPFPLMNHRAPATVPAPAPAITNFIHGMHSFRSSEELQFYMERIGGSGSNVSITDACHLRIVPTRQSDPASSSFPGGSRALPSLNVINSTPPSSSPMDMIGSLSGGSTSGTPPVPPGYQRNTYLFACELHDRSNTSRGSRNAASLSPGGALVGRNDAHTLILGYCAICQEVTLDHVRGRGGTFPR